MGIVQTIYKTVTCDGPSCKNTATFEHRQDNRGVLEAVEKYPWIKMIREVQAANRNFLFCSDQCMLESAGLGHFNPEDRKSIVLPEGANAMAHAAAQAKVAEDANRAIRSGAGLHVVRE